LINQFPKFFTSKAISYYLAVLFLVNIVFFNNMMPLIWWLFGIVAVVGFFNGSRSLIDKWSDIPEKTYIKKLFQTALIIRVIYVTIMYFLYNALTGQPFEFSPGDVLFYHGIAEFGADCLWDGKFDLTNQFLTQDDGIAFSDMGYPIYLSVIYALTAKSIFLSRILKAVWSAWMCVLVYKLATRNFGEQVGRIAGIFVMLMPNFIYYTSIQLKETEMVFLTVLFVERADYLIRGRDFSFKAILPIMLIAGALFMFRTALAAAAMFSLFTAVFLTSKRVLKMQKKIVLAVWVFITIAFFIGGTVATEIQELWMAREGNQEAMLEFRATREGGNKFATYAGAAIFAPMIFVIPFPTIVYVPGQDNQQLIHGANYVKNIMSVFVIFVLIWSIQTGKWRDFLLLGSFTLGYLLVIAFSAFAQSERFHLPGLPFIMIFAAYGISIVDNKFKKYYNWWLMFIFVAIVAWSWFKLAGRGMA